MQPSAADILEAFGACATPSSELLRAGLAAGIDWARIARRVQRGIDGGRVVYGPRMARIEPIARGCFEFVDDVEAGSAGAMIFVALTEAAEPEDLVAWTGFALHRWLGRAAMLGAENLTGVRDFTDPPLMVHFEVRAYLCGGMRGVLVLDDDAGERLRWCTARLGVDCGDNADRLGELMAGRHTPEIVVGREVAGAL